jgi:hypothetical protein
MARRLIVIALMALGTAFAVPAAQADTLDIIEPVNETAASGFQAGTCTTDEPKCSPETPELFYKQAGGHPPIGFTQYILRHSTLIPGVIEPVIEPKEGRTVKTLRVDLPPGLTVNPEALPRCPEADFLRVLEVSPGKTAQVPNCPASTVVGREEVTLVTNVAGFEPAPGTPLPKGYVIGPSEKMGTNVPVYNLVPKEGEPARFGFVIAGARVVFLETEVAWESDYHESFTIRPPAPSVPFSTLKSRLVNEGRKGDGTYITNPTTCFNVNEAANEHLYSTWFRAESYEDPDPTFPAGRTAVEAKLPIDKATGQRITLEGCEKVPFDPSIEVDPETQEVDSPMGGTVTVKLPFDPAKEGGEGISQSHLRKASVTLPKGLGLNPSGAQGLEACTDAQFRKGQRVEDNACPPNSVVGTVEIASPPLADLLLGNVYVGEQKSMDPTSGEEFRILIEAKSKKEGIVVRLVGNVSADPKTGQLTATLTDKLVGEFAGPLPEGLPQVPFEYVKLQLNKEKGILTSPPTCSPHTTDTAMEPWARPGTSVSPKAEFTLTNVPGGGVCPKTLAERRFAPSYTARSDSTKAGAYSPFRVHIGRQNGEQELKVVNVTLPKGLTGKLAGIPYCSEADLAAAAANTGAAERAKSSCSSASQLGTATTEAGTGAKPLRIAGKAYLAGPYKTAPVSLAIVTPAVAGPFDLGVVVVRVALNVNPETARITAVSDVIPDVFGGVKLDLRTINVDIDRSKFMLNPTNCKAQATSGVLQGGGGDPTTVSAFSTYAVSDPFQATGCKSLGFKPKLSTKLFGPVKRAKNPRIRAILKARTGDANIARTALTLPHSLFLDQSHIRTVCTRVQLAARACPKGAVYGHAKARTPLLDRPLKGPVYLVSSKNELPDLVADLRGQVNIHLHGIISSKRGGLKTVFTPVPDVPVKKFILNMRGGKKSLLINSTNLCKSKQSSVLNIKAQNGKKVRNNKLPLKVAACSKKK